MKLLILQIKILFKVYFSTIIYYLSNIYNMSFTDKIEELKNKIGSIITQSSENKTTNMGKISEIRQKIVKIQESVANITAASERFGTASEGLIAANLEISKCKEETLAQIALMADAKAAFDAEKLALENQTGENSAAQKVLQAEFETTIAAQAAEIVTLNESLAANIATIQQITDETNDKVNEVKTNGEELGAALVELEGDIDGLQKGVEETEDKVKTNDAAVDSSAAIETPPAAVETPSETVDLPVSTEETSIEDTVNIPPAPVETPVAPAPVETPVETVASPAATTETKSVMRQALITKLKNEIFDKTIPGNTSTKTSNAATKLMEWDREHKIKKTEASWSNNNKQFYLKIFKTSFGGSKKRTTRKKRKNRKTNRRKK